jgi:hypothetical protein
MFTKQHRCPDCGASEAYSSRPRNSLEKYFYPLFLQHPVRCANCFRRSWIPIFSVVCHAGQRPGTRVVHRAVEGKGQKGESVEELQPKPL